jgi:hypothetical protein
VTSLVRALRKIIAAAPHENGFRLMASNVLSAQKAQSNPGEHRNMVVSISNSLNARRPALNRNKTLAALLSAVTLVASASTSPAQTELKTYADAKGYINVRKLTCAQLAGTFQEDADFLGVWYAGWFNGRNKKHMINVPRVKEGLHQVIVYCKANPNKTVVEAVQTILNGK